MRFFGVVLILGAIVVPIWKQSSLPDASTCVVINRVNRSLGTAATCHSSIGAGWWIGAAAVAAFGVLLIALDNIAARTGASS